MYFKSLDYPIIVIDDDYESPRIGGILIRALVEELRKNDQRVLCGLTLADAQAGARTYVAASAGLISIDGTGRTRSSSSACWASCASRRPGAPTCRSSCTANGARSRRCRASC